jgi:hypothetical protein
MSYTSLYKVYKTKRIEIEEFRNSHGSAPPVWEYLAETQFGLRYYNDINPMSLLWNLAYDKKVNLHVRLCHAFTFDYAYVSPEHFALMSDSAARMNVILEAWPKWAGCVNHWGLISETFKNLKVDKRCIGIGMRGTSVCDVWDNYPREGKDRMFDCVRAVLQHASKEI